ncbi:uncharacterized protein EV422DRAFT_506272 [Fimicolochytrium jonesii]|uniref:uncharacterized protein n=1 Tax=Fimicolochytrium jonesii TaxID=1396493 RepID=UPI0022FECBCA|nr:uncharacterized protein EV422DRAFT_506272 [Fimicolochytrium jonesii]KAI8821055.1 hypothetical protein EV422DRAFT_506272 [Fimicolochytrium jonesii]
MSLQPKTPSERMTSLVGSAAFALQGSSANKMNLAQAIDKHGWNESEFMKAVTTHHTMYTEMNELLSDIEAKLARTFLRYDFSLRAQLVNPDAFRKFMESPNTQRFLDRNPTIRNKLQLWYAEYTAPTLTPEQQRIADLEKKLAEAQQAATTSATPSETDPSKLIADVARPCKDCQHEGHLDWTSIDCPNHESEMAKQVCTNCGGKGHRNWKSKTCKKYAEKPAEEQALRSKPENRPTTAGKRKRIVLDDDGDEVEDSSGLAGERPTRTCEDCGKTYKNHGSHAKQCTNRRSPIVLVPSESIDAEEQEE